MNPHLTVIGAGIAGLVAATLASRSGWRVTLVESADEVGGLLRSHQLSQGQVVDYGTHIPARTGDAELDRLWFDVLDDSERCELDCLIPGTVMHGHLYPHRMWPCLPDNASLGQLQSALLAAVRANVPHEHSVSTSAQEAAVRLYGEQVASEVIAPIIEKLQRRNPAELTSTVLPLFGLHRLISFDQDTTRTLKTQEPPLDAVLGHVDCQDGARRGRAFYPTRGVGAWAERLREHAEKAGVNVLTGTTLRELSHRQGRVHSVSTTEQNWKTDAVVCTIPSARLLRLAGVSFPENIRPPEMLTSVLVHQVMDTPARCDSHYLSVFDPEFRAFRVTLYQNLRPQTAPGFALTTEYLVPADEIATIDGEFAQKELRAMGVIEEGARCLDEQVVVHHGGFPILTHDFLTMTRRLAAHTSSALKNVHLAGKAGGEEFFMTDVIRSLHYGLPDWLAEQRTACL